jgi:hypothetical protein
MSATATAAIIAANGAILIGADLRRKELHC